MGSISWYVYFAFPIVLWFPPISDHALTSTASTPGLAFNRPLSFKSYVKPRPNAPKRAGTSGAIATDELLIESSDHPAIEFVGREEEAGGANSLLKHYIGVYDPATGDLQVVESRKVTVRGIVRAQRAPAEAFEEQGDYKNMREKRNDLGQTFGTKKSRKAIAALTENAISKARTAEEMADKSVKKVDAVTKAMLDSMSAATEGMATQAQLQAQGDAAKPRPKANLDAENPQDVYTVDELIGPEIMALLPVKNWQDVVVAKKEAITSSKFVSDRIYLASVNVQKLKVLRYMLAIMDFFKATMPKRGGVRNLPKADVLREAMGNVPGQVVDNIKRKFTDGPVMTKFQTDLLMTTICALALIVDNFEVDIYGLREDLKLEAKEMQAYFSEIGAKIMAANAAESKRLGLDKASAQQHKFARLRIPLEFPKAKFARK